MKNIGAQADQDVMPRSQKTVAIKCPLLPGMHNK